MSSNPYEPPHVGKPAKNRKTLGITLIVLAIVAPLLGILGTVLGMIRTFNEVATVSAQARADSLAAGISAALVWVGAGILVGVILGVVGIAMLVLSRRKLAVDSTNT